MTESQDPRLVNILGALALALSDRIRETTEASAALVGSAPGALVALDQFLGGATTEDVSQVMGLTHSGAVRLVDRLVAAGLVERNPGRDARSGSIVLTASGRVRSHQVTRARADAIERALAGMSSDDRRGLARLVGSLLTTITEQRLTDRRHGQEPPGWLCRVCDFTACRRSEGDCPSANAAGPLAGQN